jgi:hypothetical protein
VRPLNRSEPSDREGKTQKPRRKTGNQTVRHDGSPGARDRRKDWRNEYCNDPLGDPAAVDAVNYKTPHCDYEPKVRHPRSALFDAKIDEPKPIEKRQLQEAADLTGDLVVFVMASGLCLQICTYCTYNFVRAGILGPSLRGFCSLLRSSALCLIG